MVVRVRLGQTVTPLYVELRSNLLTKIVDSCQPDVVGHPRYESQRAGRESKPSREWTSMYSLYSTFQLVPQNGTNDHSITERDNVDFLKDAPNGKQQPRNSVIPLDYLEHIDR